MMIIEKFQLDRLLLLNGNTLMIESFGGRKDDAQTRSPILVVPAMVSPLDGSICYWQLSCGRTSPTCLGYDKLRLAGLGR